MTTEQIKKNLYSDKIQLLLQSDFEYLYRNTCSFIFDQYQTLQQKITDKKICRYILPLAAFADFDIKSQQTCEQQRLSEAIDTLFNRQSSKITEIKLINHPRDEEELLMALICFQQSKLNYQSINEKIKLLTIEKQEEIFQQYFQINNERQELNFFNYTFECCLDLLSLKELRNCELSAILIQNLSISNGYYTPTEIINAGLQGEYIMSMKKACAAFQEMCPTFPQLAKYIIPLAFLQKVLFTVNINQLLKLKLSYCDILWDQIKQVHPTIYQGLKDCL